MLKSGNALGIPIAAAIAMAFGLLTLVEGGTVLFGSEAARLAAGNFVPFVLRFNFMAGFVYVFAGVGLWMRKRWGLWLALSIVISTIAVFAAFGIHILLGGAFEVRTLIAMSLRTVVWVVIFVYAARSGPNPAICPDFHRSR